VFGADRGAHFGEVSVLLKFPIVLAGDPWQRAAEAWYTVDGMTT
jgi:hypothetical protein